MITGTDEQWAAQYARRCVCGDRYDEHINGRGPCNNHDGCTGFRDQEKVEDA